MTDASDEPRIVKSPCPKWPESEIEVEPTTYSARCGLCGRPVECGTDCDCKPTEPMEDDDEPVA